MGRVEQQHPGADPADNAMPGVQANCGEVGMLMNTWWTPHIPVTGGTPNDMYGYAWSPANQPKAFQQAGQVSAELVLQANIAMTGWQPTPGNQLDAGAYIAFFVYLRDTKHNLPSFGVLATTHGTGNQASYMAKGFWPSVDYCNSLTSTPIDCGGWFVSAPISPGGGESPPSNPANKKWITVRYSTPTQVYASPFFSSSTASNFFRAHITATNLKNMVQQFNNLSISCGGLVCPRGYSEEPADYVVEYAGIIFELLPGSNWTNDNSYLYPYQYGGQWVEADASKVQIAVAARMSGLAVYRYVP